MSAPSSAYLRGISVAFATLLPRLALALLAMLVPMRAESQAVSYTITNLTPASFESAAYGINAAGQVIGYYRDSFFSGRRAFLFSEGTLTDLGTLGGNTSEAYGINSSGQVVGQASTSSGIIRPFLYQDGSMLDLGSLGGLDGGAGRANAINAEGLVVGALEVFPLAPHAFLYRDGSPLFDLGGLGVSGIGEAFSINSSGQIVGSSLTSLFQRHAFLYSGGDMMDLGTLGGSTSQAWGINDAGQIVGESFTEAPFTSHAFLYSDDAMSDLGTLSGGRNSKAYAINRWGSVVGSSETCSGGCFSAFLYSAGEMIDLNTLLPPGSGWSLWEARGINDAGQIVGFGVSPSGFNAFLMTPVNPSPSITALSVSPEPPQSFGTPLTWTATATGGTPPLQYRFWRYNSATGAQTLVQDYSTSSTHSWTSGSTDIGNYRIIVWVRSAGSAAAYDDWFLGPPFTITP